MKTKRFKPGDTPTIKSFKEIVDLYGEFNIGGHHSDFVPEMKLFCGKKVTIEAIEQGGYMIEDDYFGWYWSDEMFVGDKKSGSRKGKFRVGIKQKRVVMFPNGKELVIFPVGKEKMAQEYCDFLNNK